MKKLIYPLIICLSLSGCVSTGIRYSRKDPSEFYASKRKTGAIRISGRKVSETEYLIVARGEGICTEEQVKEAWLEIAQELAAGRPIETELETKDYSYSASGRVSGRAASISYIGKMVSGTVLIIK
ncbi:hypothetical protein ACFLS1_07470 [Verrucomicrobiota bacterium]